MTILSFLHFYMNFSISQNLRDWIWQDYFVILFLKIPHIYSGSCQSSTCHNLPQKWNQLHSQSFEWYQLDKLPLYLFFHTFFIRLCNDWKWWERKWKQMSSWELSGVMKCSAAAAAKSLQLCPTLCDPIDGSSPGSPVPGILQARTLEWVAISFSNAWKWKEKLKSLSYVRLFVTPWTAAYQVPPSMGFSRKEYWSGVPLPSPMKCSKRP